MTSEIDKLKHFHVENYSGICLKGIHLEDVTEELEDKAYEEMRHN